MCAAEVVHPVVIWSILVDVVNATALALSVVDVSARTATAVVANATEATSAVHETAETVEAVLVPAEDVAAAAGEADVTLVRVVSVATAAVISGKTLVHLLRQGY